MDLMRMESDLNACSPKHMTIDEIQQEMSIVAEILQEYNGKLSLSQFSVFSYTDDEEYILYCARTVLCTKEIAVNGSIHDAHQVYQTRRNTHIRH